MQMRWRRYGVTRGGDVARQGDEEWSTTSKKIWTIRSQRRSTVGNTAEGNERWARSMVTMN